MPVLSFPCVVTRHNGSAELSRRRTWIKGHDLRALALAATEQLAVSPDRCEYMLFSPEVVPASAGVFLEVLHGGLSALVGPMGGPSLPSTLSQERAYRLEDLLTQVGLGSDDESQRAYPVLVTYAGVLRDVAYPPGREPKECDAHFETRRAAAERVRLERARHEGIHVVRYDVPPAQWQAHDLERLLGLAYRLLPTIEPRWRDSGCITQEKLATPNPNRELTMQYCLQVARGDFAAHLRLPAFPTGALSEWLAGRQCEILLCHPVMKIEAAARDSPARLRDPRES